MMNSLHPLQFDLLKNCPELFHGVYSRKGGVSQKPYDSLNLSKSPGDSPGAVQANLKRVLNHTPFKSLALANQHHGCLVHEATSESNCDALVTNQKGVGLVIRHADCQAALIYDPVQKVVGAAHSGWRGSVQNIYANTVTKLKNFYNSKPENLLICISPSLGPKSAEFIHYKKELPKPFWDFQTDQNHFDFWEISRWQLEKEGVLSHHIEIAEMDTVANPKDYFSYRRERITGRNGSLIGMV